MATVIVQQNILPREAAWSKFAARGGQTMLTLQWLLGLRALGHRAIFVNFIDPGDRLEECAEYFADVMTRWWNLSDCALVLSSANQTLAGLSFDELEAAAVDADALLTVAISGVREPPPPLSEVRPRVLIDQDPGYVHLWAQTTGDSDTTLGVHDLYFTVGGNVGTTRSSIPTLGRDWQPTWNPIFLDLWPVQPPPRTSSFSTVTDWWGLGYLEFEGRLLGPKREEFLRFLDLPSLVDQPIDIILDIAERDPEIERLTDHGWRVRSPGIVETPEDYRDWIVRSTGEFSCAKGVYVGTNSGWFSDRSAAYLAAGRPVVVQDTGLKGLLPLGEGLFAVRDVEEAAQAMAEIERDYPRHSAAARQIAEAHFATDVILPRILDAAGIGSPTAVGETPPSTASP